MKIVRTKIAIGYIFIISLIINIGYIWFNEWSAVEKLEIKNQQIDDFRKEIDDIHIRLIEFPYLVKRYWNGKMKIWNITILSVWQ